MKLFKKSLLLLAFSFGAFLTSCEKDETAQDINNQEALVDNNLDEGPLEATITNEANVAVRAYEAVGDGLGNVAWLNANEGDDKSLGHTIARHWKKSATYLDNRKDIATPSSFQTGGDYASQTVVLTDIRLAAYDAMSTAIAAGKKYYTHKFKGGSGLKIGYGYNEAGKFKTNLRYITITVAYSASLAAWYVVTAFPNFN